MPSTISSPCPDEHTAYPEHEDGQDVGTLYLPEIRRMADVVTRASQGCLGVETSPMRHIPHVERGLPDHTIADSTITLHINPPSDEGDVLELRLLRSEARSLAAMLTRAANMDELNDGPDIADRNAFELGRMIRRGEASEQELQRSPGTSAGTRPRRWKPCQNPRSGLSH